MRSLGLRIAGDTATVALLDDDGIRFATCACADLKTTLAQLGADDLRTGAGFAAPALTRVFRFPFTQPGKIRRALPLLIDDHVPGNALDYERKTIISREGDSGIARVFLIPRSAVTAAQAVMLQSGDPRMMQHEALLLLPPPQPGVSAFVWLATHTTTVLSRRDAVITGLTTIPIGRSHLGDNHAVADLRTRMVAALDEPTSVWLVDGWGRGDAEVAALMDGLDDGAPWYWVDEAPGAPADPAERVAWRAALAARERARPLWNLAPPRSLPLVAALRHPLVRNLAPATAVLLLATVLAVSSGTAALEARAKAARAELSAIYERNFPGSRIVDPLRQMRSVVDRASGSKTSAATAPLIARIAEFHSAVSAATKIDLSELRSASGEWALKGEAPDFATVDELKRTLEQLPWARDVRVQRAEQTIDKAAIRFQIAFADGNSP